MSTDFKVFHRLFADVLDVPLIIMDVKDVHVLSLSLSLSLKSYSDDHQ